MLARLSLIVLCRLLGESGCEGQFSCLTEDSSAAGPVHPRFIQPRAAGLGP